MIEKPLTITASGPVRVERNIRPPMPLSVTIQFSLDEMYPQWTIYVTYNPYAERQPSPEEMAMVAKEIKRRIEHQ